MNKLEKEHLIISLKEDDNYTNNEIHCLLKFDEFFEDSYFTNKYFRAYTDFSNGYNFKMFFILKFNDKSFHIKIYDDYDNEIIICEDYLDNMDINTVKFITKRLDNIIKNLSEINI